MSNPYQILITTARTENEIDRAVKTIDESQVNTRYHVLYEFPPLLKGWADRVNTVLDSAPRLVAWLNDCEISSFPKHDSVTVIFLVSQHFTEGLDTYLDEAPVLEWFQKQFLKLTVPLNVSVGRFKASGRRPKGRDGSLDISLVSMTQQANLKLTHNAYCYDSTVVEANPDWPSGIRAALQPILSIEHLITNCLIETHHCNQLNSETAVWPLDADRLRITLHCSPSLFTHVQPDDRDAAKLLLEDVFIELLRRDYPGIPQRAQISVTVFELLGVEPIAKTERLKLPPDLTKLVQTEQISVSPTRPGEHWGKPEDYEDQEDTGMDTVEVVNVIQFPHAALADLVSSLETQVVEALTNSLSFYSLRGAMATECKQAALYNANTIITLYGVAQEWRLGYVVVIVPNSPYEVIADAFNAAYGYLGYRFMEIGTGPEDFLNRLRYKNSTIVHVKLSFPTQPDTAQPKYAR